MESKSFLMVFVWFLLGPPWRLVRGPITVFWGLISCLLGPHKLCFRTFKGPIGTKMGPFGAWTLSKLCKYHSKIPKRIQRALIGLQKDYFEPKNTEKCLGFAIEKKILLYRASWGPPGPPWLVGPREKFSVVTFCLRPCMAWEERR